MTENITYYLSTWATSTVVHSLIYIFIGASDDVFGTGTISVPPRRLFQTAETTGQPQREMSTPDIPPTVAAAPVSPQAESVIVAPEARTSFPSTPDIQRPFPNNQEEYMRERGLPYRVASSSDDAAIPIECAAIPAPQSDGGESSKSLNPSQYLVIQGA